MGLLILMSQLVGFLLMSVISVAVGQKILSYLNTRPKFYGYLIGMAVLSTLLGVLINVLMMRQAHGQGVIQAPYNVEKDIRLQVKPLTDLLEEVAEAEGIPVNIFIAICTVESRLNPSTINEDDGNGPSVGLCQIKPETARLMGFTGKFKELLKPETNALYAAKYFRWQLDRYFGNIEYAIAAYNSGSLNLNEKKQIRNIKYVRKVQLVASEF